MRTFIQALGTAALIAVAAPATASVTIGSYVFADNAFADTVTSTGNLVSYPGALEAALTDKSIDSGAYADGEDSTLGLGFTDNTVFNGAGADLVIFEEGDETEFQLTINGQSQLVTSIFQGFTNVDGFNVNAIAIDLSDFGLGSGATISGLSINMSGVSATNFALPVILEVGAISTRDTVTTVPEPASWALVAFALAGLTAVRRRA